jgi:uncharacterized protein (TIGR02271 family)
MSNANNRLQKLSGSGFEIADGEPDIRGWDVMDGQGANIGEVDELLFDKQSQKVRYLIVELDDDYSGFEDKHVLVPIGLAEIHSSDDDVLLSNVSRSQLLSLPEYDENNFTADTETTIRNVFAGAGAAALGAGAALGHEDFYEHEHFDDNRLYNSRKSEQPQTTVPVIEENLQIGKREVATGGVRIKSSIVEQPVQETVSLRQEHVTIERTPVDRPVGENNVAPFEEMVIEAKETAEIPVVSKDVRVVEEITVDKNVEYREEVINETLRSTEVEVEQLVPDKNRSADLGQNSGT